MLVRTLTCHLSKFAAIRTACQKQAIHSHRPLQFWRTEARLKLWAPIHHPHLRLMDAWSRGDRPTLNLDYNLFKKRGREGEGGTIDHQLCSCCLLHQSTLLWSLKFGWLCQRLNAEYLDVHLIHHRCTFVHNMLLFVGQGGISSKLGILPSSILPTVLPLIFVLIRCAIDAGTPRRKLSLNQTFSLPLPILWLLPTAQCEKKKENKRLRVLYLKTSTHWRNPHRCNCRLKDRIFVWLKNTGTTSSMNASLSSTLNALPCGSHVTARANTGMLSASSSIA